MAAARRLEVGETAPGRRPTFQSTVWIEVATAREGLDSEKGRDALQRLCLAYWQPVYAFVRKRGYSPEESEDLTQGFFAEFLRKGAFGLADPQRGRFRSFLTASVDRYLSHERARASAQKRGAGIRPLPIEGLGGEELWLSQLRENETPAKALEKTWIRCLLRRILARLMSECESGGKRELFEQIQRHLWGDFNSVPYADLARQHGMSLVGVKVAAHRLRLRCRELLRAELAQTVASITHLDDEIRYLMRVLGE